MEFKNKDNVSVNKLFSFKEYPRIELGKRGKCLENPEAKLTDWVVLEKVHGANFSFYCDGHLIGCSKRNSLLEEHETFYSYQKVKEKYSDAVLAIFNEVNKSEEVASITIYGELFGGMYPHKDVEDLGYLHIQKGVYYTNSIEFYAFDIWIAEKNQEKTWHGRWMNYYLAMELFKKYGMFYAQPLYAGTAEECFKFNYKINTTIPELLGHPPILKNQMEGIVVKPVEPFILKRKGGGGARVIFKLKNANFEEVNPKAEPSKHESARMSKINAIDTCYEEIERYINENRLNSVASKIGPITASNAKEAAIAMSDDVMTDFCKDCEQLWQRLDTDFQAREIITKNTKSKVQAFITSWLLQENLRME